MLLSRVPAESRGCDGEGHTPPPRLRRGCIGQPRGQAFTRPRDFAPLERSLHASYWRGRATGTDFRPSIIGVGGACASRRTVCESGRERWRGGAGAYPTSGFRPPRVLHAYWRGRATGTDFRPSIIGVGGACASRRTVCESGRERWRGGAGVYPTSGFRPTHHNTRPTCALTECNSHLDEALAQTVRRSSKAGFGRLHVRTCHTPCNASTGPCTSTLRSDSRPSASRGEETLGEVFRTRHIRGTLAPSE